MSFPPDAAGVFALPSGVLVRGRRIDDTPECDADLTLALARGPRPPWDVVEIDWPDFGVPRDGPAAVAALRAAHQRAHAGDRVEACCRGGTGRTGTALAALAVFDGLAPHDAVAWVRARYRPRAVETPWQRSWLRRLL